MSSLHDSPDDGETVDAPPTIPVPDDVAEAVRTLIRWAGDDPEREGLLDTPRRVARAWKEYCAGYADDPAHHLARVFEEVRSEEHKSELQSLMRNSYAVFC